MAKNLLLILGIFIAGLFLGLSKTQAADSDVVINEVMVYPNSGNEWVELYNNSDSDPVDLTGWTIRDAANPEIDISDLGIIPAHGFAVYYHSGGWLNNSAPETVVISNGSIDIDVVKINEVGDHYPAQGQSIARSPNGHDTDIDSEDFIIEIAPTPGAENNLPVIPDPPVPPSELKVTANNNLATLSWLNNDTQPITFEIWLSKNVDMSAPEVYDGLIKTEFSFELDYATYYWRLFAFNSAGDEVFVDGPSFTLVAPVYSKNIIVNEVLPHPADGVDFEFIELFNVGTESIDLGGWFLDDLADGGSTPFEIPAGTIIGAGKYLSFYKTATKISLNDSGDWARLLSPDGQIISSTNYTETAALDLAWARDADGDWEWTEELTPGEPNIIYITPDDEEENDGMGGADEEEIIINTTPIEIKTGEFRNFNQKLVAATGTVITTSGNTFYLDDGSGQAKIYIQDKTGIEKPPMHKGDIFQIIGIVDLYRNTWRILPQKQSDVKLIQCIKEVNGDIETSSSSTAKSTAKSSTAGKTTTQARAPTTPIVKEVKAAENSAVEAPGNNHISWWTQIAKMFTGLAVIFLIVLIIKVRKFPKVKVIGGHFGEDET